MAENQAIEEKVDKSNNIIERKKAMVFDKMEFAKLIISDLSTKKSGKSLLKKYKQSEVREILENYMLPQNQKKLVEISRLLFANSPQYKRLVQYFGGMATFAHVLLPVKDIKKYKKDKVLKEYVQTAELIKLMNLRHEMTKVMLNGFVEDVFYGYVHKTKNDFYIQKIDSDICKITSVQDGVYNYSIDMTYFQRNEDTLHLWADEIQQKYVNWKQLKSKNPRLNKWVELSAENTICIKINEEILEIFPPFAGTFDAIYDIEGFKRLRKDREEIGNYMILSQQLPIRHDSEHDNDFLIDRDMMMYFHNMVADVVPENVGVITSPMKVEPIRFDKDKVDNDGVAKAERDFWSGSGTSQLLFNADKSTSQGLLMSIKTDEEIIFGVLTQIERWVNRYLKFQFKDPLFNVDILDVTHFNEKEKMKTYLESAQYGIPVKSHISATLGLSPIETVNMAYLENDILELHEKFIPLQSSHTMGKDSVLQNKGEDGRPKKDATEISDETARGHDKPNANV